MKQAKRQLRKNRNKFVSELTIGILTNVAKGTPFDTGRARYSWTVTKNAPASVGYYEYVNRRAGQSNYGRSLGALSSISRGVPVARSYNGERDKSIHISNTLRYIQRLNEGWSTQAPPGYVQKSTITAIASVRFERFTF